MGLVMAVAGDGLMATTPGGPIQDTGQVVWRGGQDGEEQTPNLRDAQPDQRVAPFFVC